MKSIILFSILHITGCSIRPYTKYLASEAEVTILSSGEPVPYATITRKVCYQSDRDIMKEQVAVTNENGIAKFEEVERPGLIIWATISNYISYYHINTVSEYRYLGFTEKMDPARYSDISFYPMDRPPNDTVLVLECDIDTISRQTSE